MTECIWGEVETNVEDQYNEILYRLHMVNNMIGEEHIAIQQGRVHSTLFSKGYDYFDVIFIKNDLNSLLAHGLTKKETEMYLLGMANGRMSYELQG